MGQRKLETQSVVSVPTKDIAPDELKRNVLVFVTDGNYDEAISLLHRFLAIESDYPNYKSKTERFVKHSIDLINAIRAKKNFPGLNMLTRSKQQEIGDKITDHYNELQFSLSRVGVVLQQIKREDVRSTLWLFRSLVYAGWLIMIIALLVEVSGGLYRIGSIVIDDVVEKFLNWLFALF
jgi:hypothetical protein